MADRGEQCGTHLVGLGQGPCRGGLLRRAVPAGMQRRLGQQTPRRCADRPQRGAGRVAPGLACHHRCRGRRRPGRGPRRHPRQGTHKVDHLRTTRLATPWGRAGARAARRIGSTLQQRDRLQAESFPSRSSSAVRGRAPRNTLPATAASVEASAEALGRLPGYAGRQGRPPH